MFTFRRRFSMQYKKPEYCAMIEDYINSYRNRQGSAPSVRQIASGVGLAVGTVSKYPTTTQHVSTSAQLSQTLSTDQILILSSRAQKIRLNSRWDFDNLTRSFTSLVSKVVLPNIYVR